MADKFKKLTSKQRDSAPAIYIFVQSIKLVTLPFYIQFCKPFNALGCDK